MMGRSGESVQWQGVGVRMIDIMSAAGCVAKRKEAWSRDPRDRDVPCCEDSIPEFPENLQIPPCPAEVQLLHEILHILYARETPAMRHVRNKITQLSGAGQPQPLKIAQCPSEQLGTTSR